MKVDGEVAIITGASGGIGAVVSRDLAAQGARVAMIARTLPTLERVRKGLGDLAERCRTFPCDVGDWDAVQRTVKQIASEMGDPLILVNNAGFAAAIPFAQMEASEMEGLLADDPLHKEKIELEDEVRRLNNIRSEYAACRRRAKEKLARAPLEIKAAEESIAYNHLHLQSMN
jgi:NAD(P)-dependent dehydrogenase (short-subunit alcohol dehydrogenase family)